MPRKQVENSPLSWFCLRGGLYDRTIPSDAVRTIRNRQVYHQRAWAFSQGTWHVSRSLVVKVGYLNPLLPFPPAFSADSKRHSARNSAIRAWRTDTASTLQVRFMYIHNGTRFRIYLSIV